MNIEPYRSICDWLVSNENKYGNAVYLRQPREGTWIEFTWSEVLMKAKKVAAFLKELGLKPGTHVSIFSKNCAEWFIADFGITLAGLVNVPLFANQQEKSIEFVLNHAEVQLVFVGKLDHHHASYKAIPRHLPSINFDYHPDLKTTYSWSEVMSVQPAQEVNFPKPDDTYTIIYTSGTAGTPKGAVYTHQSISNYLAVFSKDIRRLADLESYRLLSYLPLAHVYERSAIQVGSLAIPSTVSFVESLESFADNLREVRPNLFAAVPRIWDVFQHKIQQKIPPRVLNILINVPIVSGIIKRKIIHQLGLNESKGNISGAAHLPESIARFFDKLDIIILEGYGQSENFAYATVSLPANRKLGFVGTPRLGVEIKLGAENELLLTSPCLMKEYFKEKEATQKVFTPEGWLKTGDIGMLDAENRVKILGRISENFKNLKGEFIAPTPIENRFHAESIIEHLCLVGRELPSNILLVTLSDEARSLPLDELKAIFQERLHNTNLELKNYEKISHVLVLKEKWTIENNLLTPTLKVRRREVEMHYKDLIQIAVKDHNPVIFED